MNSYQSNQNPHAPHSHHDICILIGWITLQMSWHVIWNLTTIHVIFSTNTSCEWKIILSCSLFLKAFFAPSPNSADNLANNAKPYPPSLSKTASVLIAGILGYVYTASCSILMITIEKLITKSTTYVLS